MPAHDLLKSVLTIPRNAHPTLALKKILAEAAAVGDATAWAIGYRLRGKEGYFFDNSNWRLAFFGGYKFEWQPGVANLDAAAFFFFLATGVTPAMDTKIVGEGSTYPWAAAARTTSCICRHTFRSRHFGR